MNRSLLAAAILAAPASSAIAQDAGDVAWRFQMESTISGSMVAAGPDGTVYAADDVQLYAINPDGSLKWARPGLAGDGIGIDFLDDGTIITATFDTIYALENDGSTKWTYSFDGQPFAQQIEVGPTIGPDGNIYAVSGTNGDLGLGAFSLTPAGELRWADPGSPILNPINAGTGARLQFTSDRAIFPFRYTGHGSAQIFGFDLDGDQTLYVDFTCTGAPATDSLDRVLIAGRLRPRSTRAGWRTELLDRPARPGHAPTHHRRGRHRLHRDVARKRHRDRCRRRHPLDVAFRHRRAEHDDRAPGREPTHLRGLHVRQSERRDRR